MFDVRCFSNILHHDIDRSLEVSDNVWDRWTILSDPDEASIGRWIIEVSRPAPNILYAGAILPPLLG